jgi:hypothetical protein
MLVYKACKLNEEIPLSSGVVKRPVTTAASV